jgi:hypothetical protein
MRSMSDIAAVPPQSLCRAPIGPLKWRIEHEAEQATKVAAAMASFGWQGREDKMASAYHEVSNARLEIVRISVYTATAENEVRKPVATE